MNLEKHAFELAFCVFFISFLIYYTLMVRLTNAQFLMIFYQRYAKAIYMGSFQ